MSDLTEGLGSEIVDMIHTPCGEVVFRWKRRPRRGDKAEARMIILLDGSKPQHGGVIWCEHCCELVGDRSLWPDGGWEPGPPRGWDT